MEIAIEFATLLWLRELINAENEIRKRWSILQKALVWRAVSLIFRTVLINVAVGLTTMQTLIFMDFASPTLAIEVK